MDEGIDAQARALKPLDVPHLSCSETGALIVVITRGPLGGLIWKLCNTWLQFAFVYAQARASGPGHLQSPPQ